MSKTQTLQTTQTSKVVKLKAPQVIEEDDPSTDAYYFQAIEEAGYKIQTQRRELDEVKGKHEIVHKLLREKADEVKTLKTELEIQTRKNEIFQTRNKNFNKEAISNKINQCFKKRDKSEEEIIRKNLEAYEQSLRDEYK